MGAFVVVVFVQPVATGLTFERSRWPLHITLTRFDTKEDADVVMGRLGPALTRHLGFLVRVGGDDYFGRNGTVHVSLVEPEPRLQRLHEECLAAVGPESHLLSPHHTGKHFRPHISHTMGRLYPGDEVAVRQAALVDMRPDSDSRFRRVLGVWDSDADAGTNPPLNAS
jgi:2'-5' RNA ligase